MKTSSVAEALVRSLAAARSLFDAGGPLAAHPLTGAVRETLDGSLVLAEALAEDARAREGAAQAARAPVIDGGPAHGPTFGGTAAIPIPTRAPTGHGIVAADPPPDA